jgi:hypothetical protein
MILSIDKESRGCKTLEHDRAASVRSAIGMRALLTALPYISKEYEKLGRHKGSRWNG